jgi:hypothetical protein
MSTTLEQTLEEWAEQRGLERGIARGGLEVSRRLLCRWLADCFGPVPDDLRGQIDQTKDLGRLERAIRRCPSLSSLDELELKQARRTDAFPWFYAFSIRRRWGDERKASRSTGDLPSCDGLQITVPNTRSVTTKTCWRWRRTTVRTSTGNSPCPSRLPNGLIHVVLGKLLRIR